MHGDFAIVVVAVAAAAAAAAAAVVVVVVVVGGGGGVVVVVGGRVREGKPPKLWSHFGHDFQTPATGAVDLIATRIGPIGSR